MNKCLVKVVVYKATIRSENETKNYLGSTDGTFKKKWYNHISDFYNQKSTKQKYRSIYGSLKITALNIK